MATPPLACVIECSTIGSMSLLAVIVVLTRIGVNKRVPAGDATGAEKRAHSAGPTAANILLMIAIGAVFAAAVAGLTFAFAPTE